MTPGQFLSYQAKVMPNGFWLESINSKWTYVIVIIKKMGFAGEAIEKSVG
jgi:hypothetical protein